MGDQSRLIGTGRLVLAAIGLVSVVGTVVLWIENGEAFVDLGASSLVILATWAIYGAIAVGWVVRAQRYGRRPTQYAVAALAWGGLAAGAIAQQTNIAVAVVLAEMTSDVDSSWTTVPIVEETLKALAVVALATIPRAGLRGTLDGLFYGVMAGAGFLVVENVVYTVGAVDENTSLGFTIFGMLVVRGVIGGLLSHVVYTGLIGAGIGYFVARRRSRPGRAAAVLMLACVVAVGAHAVHNTRDGLTLVTFVVSLVPLVALLVVLRPARADERDRLAGLARAGIAAPTVTAEDVRDLDADPDRTRSVLAYVRAVDADGSDSDTARRAGEALSADSVR